MRRNYVEPNFYINRKNKIKNKIVISLLKINYRQLIKYAGIASSWGRNYVISTLQIKKPQNKNNNKK